MRVFERLQNRLAQPLMRVTEENIQHSLIQQFFSELPVNPETEVHLEFYILC